SWWTKRFTRSPDPKATPTAQALEEIIHDLDRLVEDKSFANQRLHTILKDQDDREKWNMVFFILAVHFVAVPSPGPTGGETSDERVKTLDRLIAKINAREAVVSDCEILWTASVKRLLHDLAELSKGSDPDARIWQVNRNRTFNLSTTVSRLT